MENRRRRAPARWVPAVAIVVAVLVYVLLTSQPKGVDIPADDAAPERVVSAYIQALDAGDCVTAGALVTEGTRERAASWCKKVDRMSDAHVGQHFVEEPEMSNRSAPDEVVGVPVTFDLHWRVFHNDNSMDEGQTNWSYWLVRSSASEPWRIFTEGNG